MNQPNPSLTLMILVDALRPDYVARMPYLRTLARTSCTGRLRECFGFVPRAAYFGGLNAEQFGFTNMFCFDPSASPFTASRWMPHIPQGAMAERAAGIRGVVEKQARSRVPHFAKSYVSSGDIPLPWLRYFDLVEKRAPWDRRVGFRSLFHLLDDAGISWHQCSWPDSNRLQDSSDTGIVRNVLSEVTTDHRFSYVHLQELDGIGHTHGPNSAEMHRALVRADRHCETLIEGLRETFSGRVNVVLFGDHGMVNVTRTFNAQEILADLNLDYGADFAYFLDSTMIRFWFFHSAARSTVEAAFREVQGGRLLDDDDLRYFGIRGCDIRNGELIFLADPGVLIFPNFFQGHGEPIKGMHGYDPDSPDNLGYFLWHEPARTPESNRFIGKVDPPELFGLCQHLLGIDSRTHGINTQPRWRTPEGAVQHSHRYTSHADQNADKAIDRQLQHIVDSIRARIGPFDAVILTGSFGRGEGGVVRDESGQFHPVNDYDLLVVSPTNHAEALAELGGTLASELGIDYVDLGWSDGNFESFPNTVAHYDLKHGSQVIAGDPSTLDRLPDYASADLPTYEAVKLLLNRTAGLLTGLRGDFLDQPTLSVKQHRYLSNQIAKALMALGDWHLIRWQGYDSSYLVRRERFAALAPGAGLDPEAVRRITEAYAFKCAPDYNQYPCPLEEIQSLFPSLEMDLIHSINLMTEGSARELAEAMDLYLEYMSSDLRVRVEENRFCEAHSQFRPLIKSQQPPPFSWRHWIYSNLTLLLKACMESTKSAPTFVELVRRLEPWLTIPGIGHAAAPGDVDSDAKNPAFQLAESRATESPVAQARRQSACQAPTLSILERMDSYSTRQTREAIRASLIQAWFAVCH